MLKGIASLLVRDGGLSTHADPFENGKPVATNKREIPDPALAHENRLKMLRGSATRAARGARLALAPRARALSAFRDAYLVYSSA